MLSESSPAEFVVGDRPDWLAAADFNGDGRTDLAVVNGNSDTLTLLQTPSTVASHFRVNVLPATATAGVAFQVSVAALDGNNHLIPGYRGSVTLSGTDGLATLPATYGFTAADHGSHRPRWRGQVADLLERRVRRLLEARRPLTQHQVLRLRAQTGGVVRTLPHGERPDPQVCAHPYGETRGRHDQLLGRVEPPARRSDARDPGAGPAPRSRLVAPRR